MYYPIGPMSRSDLLYSATSPDGPVDSFKYQPLSLHLALSLVSCLILWDMLPFLKRSSSTLFSSIIEELLYYHAN